MASSDARIAQVKGPHLIVESLRDELVVFDRRTNKAHLLDARAAAIWRAAENGCSMDDVAGVVEGKTIEEKRTVAQLGVSDLERAGLLMSDLPAMPRRGLLKTLGTAAIVPMVISILAPSPAAAASNVAAGAPCVFGTDTCVTSATCINNAVNPPTTRCCYANGFVLSPPCPNNKKDLRCCSYSCVPASSFCN